MSWLYQSKKPVATLHNGTMRLSRLFGVWTLWGHDDSYQGGSYMDGVWKKAVGHTFLDGLEVRRCLILGVAMGGTFGIVQRAWPDADIVGVDWEPALFRLGTELGVFRPDARVQFIEGDARNVVPTLGGKFDLVLVDLFNGRKVTDAVADRALQAEVAARVRDGGRVAVNCYRQPEALEGWSALLGTPRMIRYSSNLIGLYDRAPLK